MAIYILDTRNQKDAFVQKSLTDLGHKIIRSKLPFGDVAISTDLLNVIDIKSSGGGLIELSKNICSQDHTRLRKEIQRCADCGGSITFLCIEPGINCIDDIANWKVPCFSKYYHRYDLRGLPMTKVKPETLMKAIKTMSTPNRYDCKVTFEFITKENSGAKIIELLSQNNA